MDSRSLYMSRLLAVQHLVPTHASTQPTWSNIINTQATVATRTSAHAQARNMEAERTTCGQTALHAPYELSFMPGMGDMRAALHMHAKDRSYAPSYVCV